MPVAGCLMATYIDACSFLIKVALLDNALYVKDGSKKGLFNAVFLLAWYMEKFNTFSDSDNAESDRYIESNDDEDSYM